MCKASTKLTMLLAACAAATNFGGVTRGDTALTSFTFGDVVVVRTGSASSPDYGNQESAVYLDEYTIAGAYVGTVAVNSSQLTLPSYQADQHEGLLNLSPNHQWLSFAGYTDAPNNTLPADADGSLPRVIGLVGNSAASLNTAIPVNGYNNASPSSFNPNPFLRGATTLDGTSFWTFGKYDANSGESASAPPNGGLQYVSIVTPTTPAVTTTTPIEGYGDWRDMVVANGQLCGGTGSSSVGVHGVYTISNPSPGLPTTGGPIDPGTGYPENTSSSGTPANRLITNYTGNLNGNNNGDSASCFAFATVNAPAASKQNGYNVLYSVGDEGTPNITKYYFNGSIWVTAATNPGSGVYDTPVAAVDPTGVIAQTDPNNPAWVDLYISGFNGVYTYIDKGGPTAGIPTNAFQLLTTSFPTNYSETFRGMAFAPANVFYWAHASGNLWTTAQWTSNAGNVLGGGAPATPGLEGDIAVFDSTHVTGSAGGVIDLSGAKTVGEVDFAGTIGYQLGLTGTANTLTFNNSLSFDAVIQAAGGATHSIAAPVIISGVSANANGRLDINLEGGTTVQFTGGLTVPAGGQINVNSGDVNDGLNTGLISGGTLAIGGTLSHGAGATFNINSGTVVFTNGNWPADVINVGDPTIGLPATATLQAIGGATHAAATAASIAAGSRLNVDLSTGGTVTLGSLTQAAGGILNLNGGAVVLTNGAASLGTYRSELQTGRNAGSWSYAGSAAAISSSTATANNGEEIGYLTGNAYNALHPGNSLGLGANDVVFQLAMPGDASLSGEITPADYRLMDAAYLTGAMNPGWVGGDFNYDGVVDYRDYALADAAYAAQTGAQAQGIIALHAAEFGAEYTSLLSLDGMGVSEVPEPGSLLLLGAGALGFLELRRAERKRPRDGCSTISNK